MDDRQDLTARARIRDAALELFAERGVAGTSLRSVAERASVSLALVQYHFTSKAGLASACDDYVVEFFRNTAKQAADGAVSDPQFISAARRDATSVWHYLGRALADDTPAAAVIFDELLILTQEYLPGDKEETVTEAAVFVAMRLGVYVLHQHISRAIGVDAVTPAGMHRISTALLKIISPSFVGAAAAEQAETGLAGARPDDGEQ
ncbi:TetR family transcriptional regulator [Microlunatus soli]|nr:TetR family transcriptional regulator [Microlunatus soli]